MRLSPYERFQQKELILRDHLAIDRTALASERTLLAYIRTSFTLFITGLFLIKFFDSLFMQISGWIFIIAGIIIIFLGGIRYLKFRNNLYKAVKESKDKK